MEELAAKQDSCLQDDVPSPEFDPHEEAKLIRKLDFFIIPITMVLYLLSFLDR